MEQATAVGVFRRSLSPLSPLAVRITNLLVDRRHRRPLTEHADVDAALTSPDFGNPPCYYVLKRSSEFIRRPRWLKQQWTKVLN